MGSVLEYMGWLLYGVGGGALEIRVRIKVGFKEGGGQICEGVDDVAIEPEIGL